MDNELEHFVDRALRGPWLRRRFWPSWSSFSREAAGLLISGRREEAKEIKEEEYDCAERAVGEFSRAISLPEGVKAEEIQATYKDRVLEVILPRPAASAETTSVKVPVRQM